MYMCSYIHTYVLHVRMCVHVCMYYVLLSFKQIFIIFILLRYFYFYFYFYHLIATEPFHGTATLFSLVASRSFEQFMPLLATGFSFVCLAIVNISIYIHLKPKLQEITSGLFYVSFTSIPGRNLTRITIQFLYPSKSFLERCTELLLFQF